MDLSTLQSSIKSYAEVTGGTKLDILPIYVPNSTYKIKGVHILPLHHNQSLHLLKKLEVITLWMSMVIRRLYPESDSYYFEMGSGWFEQTPQHRANETIDVENSNFTGSNPNIQTSLEPYTYGEKYFNKFRNFPNMNLGYELISIKDNKKSWTRPKILVLERVLVSLHLIIT